MPSNAKHLIAWGRKMNILLIRKMVSIFAIVVFSLLIVLLIWYGWDNLTLWKILGTCMTALVAISVALRFIFGWPLSPQIEPDVSLFNYDSELKLLEVQSKRQELEIKKLEAAQKVAWLTRWNNPVVLAVMAAVIGYFGTLINWSLTRSDESNRQEQTLRLEETKQKASENSERMKLQGSLILDALKTGEGSEKSKQAAVNLLLLADAGLVTFEADIRKRIEAWSKGQGGVGPGLPSPNPTIPEALDDNAIKKIREDVAFAINELNILFDKKLSLPDVKPSQNGDENAYMDVDNKIVYVPRNYSLYTPDIAFRQVAHLYRPLWEYADEHGSLGTSVADIWLLF
jgi:hypothetical protein